MLAKIAAKKKLFIVFFIHIFHAIRNNASFKNLSNSLAKLNSICIKKILLNFLNDPWITQFIYNSN